MLAHRRLDVLLDGEAREQRALLKQHAPALFDAAPLGRRKAVDVLAIDLDLPGPLGQQAEDRAGQHRLARPRAADEAEHLAAVDVEVEAVHHQPIAEADLKPAHADDDLAGRRTVGGAGPQAGGDDGAWVAQ